MNTTPEADIKSQLRELIILCYTKTLFAILKKLVSKHRVVCLKGLKIGGF